MGNRSKRSRCRANSLQRQACNDTSAGAGDLIRSRFDDVVPVAAVPETIVGGVAGVPGACVEGTVGAKGYLVLGKDVRVEEVARLIFAIGVGVGLLVISLGLACSSTESRVVRVVVGKAHAVVGIVAVVKGRATTFGEGSRSLEGIDTGQILANLAVTVGACISCKQMLSCKCWQSKACQQSQRGKPRRWRLEDHATDPRLWQPCLQQGSHR